MNRNDAGELRERLAEIRSRGFLSPRMLRTEHRVVTRIARLTGLTAEEIRTTADKDAQVL
jgi:hypothetical protein